MPSDRKLLQEIVILPGTGKALEMRRGQVLRIAQAAGARQCADFNCSICTITENSSTPAGPISGDFLWSAPPRERPMMAIIEDTVGTNDVLYPRLSAFANAVAVHTIAMTSRQAQREYGLTQRRAR